jgi:hypothetical protein
MPYSRTEIYIDDIHPAYTVTPKGFILLEVQGSVPLHALNNDNWHPHYGWLMKYKRIVRPDNETVSEWVPIREATKADKMQAEDQTYYRIVFDVHYHETMDEI